MTQEQRSQVILVCYAFCLALLHMLQLYAYLNRSCYSVADCTLLAGLCFEDTSNAGLLCDHVPTSLLSDARQCQICWVPAAPVLQGRGVTC